MPPPPRIPDQWMDAKIFKDIEHFDIGSFKAKLRTDRYQIIKLQSSKVKKGKNIIRKKNKHQYKPISGFVDCFHFEQLSLFSFEVTTRRAVKIEML